MNIAIVEDEREAALSLEQNIRACMEKMGADVAMEIKVFNEPFEFLEGYKSNYDVVFLDIQMPNLNGIKLAHKLRELDKEVPIVFVTNLKQMAIRGYEVNALDFIVKPVTYYGLELTMRKVLKNLAMRKKDFLTIATKDGVKRVSVSEITYIETVSHRLIYHLIDDEISQSGVLKDLEEKLQDSNFRKCNNCYLVNMHYVSEVRKNSIIINGKDELQISRTRKKQFLEELSRYWGG